MVAGGLAADSEHAALANSYPTPPTHENQQHTLSPGIELMDTTCSLTAFGDSSLNIKVSLRLRDVVLVSVQVKCHCFSQDYSFVHKPTLRSSLVGTINYAPIDLPSLTNSVGSQTSACPTYVPLWRSTYMHRLPAPSTVAPASVISKPPSTPG